MTEIRPTRERLDSLTGLRFFAAFAVFGYHGLNHGELIGGKDFFGAGMSGVSFFFIVSGFVLAWSAHGNVSAGAFVRRRFARIYPAYFVAWMGSLILLICLGDRVTLEDFAAPTLLQSWVPIEAIYFGGNAVFWSLSCEAFFYLTFPLIFRIVRNFSSRTLAILSGVCVGIPVVTASALLRTDGTAGFWAVSIFPPTRLPEFVLGILMALLLQRGRAILIPLWSAGPLALAAVCAAAQAPTSFSFVVVTIIPFALLIWSAASADMTGTASPFRLPWAVSLGVWSYCFYLVHSQTQGVWFAGLRRVGVNVQELSALQFTLALVPALVGAMIGAWLLHTFVEAPLERRLRRRSAARID